MTKDEFANELRKRGFTAKNEKGCVMVTTPDMKDLQTVQAIAQQVGYGLSFGWRKQEAQNGNV